ncbi:MAG: TetR/AcrR family transcriptional regulator [Thermodesulfobacteriota bacterium]
MNRFFSGGVFLDKREDILQAALTLFAERGYHGTAVALIAEKAQVGSGTIYRYFRDKEQLVNELYRFWKTEMVKAVREDLPENLPLRTLFHETWIRWVEFAMRHREAYTFLIAHHHAPYLDQASVAMSEQLHNEYLAFFEIGRRQEIIKDVEPQLIMAIVTGIFSEMLREYWAGHLKLTPEIIVQAEEACWHAIRR